MDEELVTVVETKDFVELNFLLSFLEGGGFEVWQDSRRNIPYAQLIYMLKVRESEAQRALKFLQDLRNSTPDNDV